MKERKTDNHYEDTEVKVRLDKLLSELGFYASRTRAQEAITKGLVLVDKIAVTNPAKLVSQDSVLKIMGDIHPYVSRGALKLEAALSHWDMPLKGAICADIGASTGGFTEVLLAHGVDKVYAVDVGHGQLHSTLKDDKRVVSMEGTHIFDLEVKGLPEVLNIIVADLSFISLEKVLPVFAALLKSGGHVIMLVKPQFEVGKGNTKEGIVRDESLYEEVLSRISARAIDLGFQVKGWIPSPILGGSGNKEFLMHLMHKGD